MQGRISGRTEAPEPQHAAGTRQGWWSVAETRNTWARFHQAWIDLPFAQRRRYLVTLAWGWAIAGALMVAMSFAGRAVLTPDVEAREARVLEAIVAMSPFEYEMAVFFESPGNGPIALSIGLLAAILLARRRQPLEAISALAAPLLAGTIAFLGWNLWERERPHFLYEGLPEAGLSAFPSGHASMAIPLYGFLAYLWLRRSPAVTERILVSLFVLGALATVLLSRMVLGSHWPTDVVAGAIIGAAVLATVVAALRRGARPMPGDERVRDPWRSDGPDARAQ